MTLIPVALDRSPEDVGSFLSKTNISMPVLLSSTNQAFSVGARTLPTTLVLAADGTTRRMYVGAQAWESKTFSDQVLADLHH